MTMSTKFHPLLSKANCFQDILHFMIYINYHVKIPKCHRIFKTWLIAKKSNSKYSPMVANVLMKFN